MMQEMSSAAAGEVIAEIEGVDPACSGAQRKDCVEGRVYDLSRRAAAGFADGLVERLRVPFLIAAFVAGALVALAIGAVMRRSRRPAASGPTM